MKSQPTVHLFVVIELSGDSFAAEDELNLRDRLVEAIEDGGIGEVGGFGSGLGCMDMSVIVRDEQKGREQITALIGGLAPGAAFTIKTLPSESEDS